MRNTHTKRQEGFLKYAVEMGAMIYTPSFINIGSTIQKLMGEYIDRKKIA
jgi:hypothetical protein